MKTAIIVTPEITFKGVYVVEETETEIVVVDSLEATKAIVFSRDLITAITYSEAQ